MITSKLFLNFLTVCIIGSIVISCEQNKLQTSDTPFMTVVKLESAISFADSENAKKHIDIKSVYGEIAKKESRSVDSIWQEFIRVNARINNSKKLVSAFPFHKYNIVEKIKGKDAIVKLIPMSKKKEIIYKLISKNGSWIVTAIKRY